MVWEKRKKEQTEIKTDDLKIPRRQKNYKI